jgi:hypothetical protein
VLHFWDDRVGALAELAVGSSVPLRICVHGPADGAWSGRADLRVLLVADVLTRIAELHGQQVIAVLAAASPPPAAFDRDVSALGIYPPVYASPGGAETALGGPAHVHVIRNEAGPGAAAGGLLLGVGAVEDLTQREAGEENGRDPLALRLALLSHPYRQPVRLAPDALADAAGSLGRWRAMVAGWAGAPSRPIPAEAAAKIRDAFDENLNTAAALGLLRSMESSREVPAGAKFETFVFVDRVLGLELAREIGRPGP